MYEHAFIFYTNVRVPIHPTAADKIRKLREKMEKAQENQTRKEERLVAKMNSDLEQAKRARYVCCGVLPLLSKSPRKSDSKKTLLSLAGST